MDSGTGGKSRGSGLYMMIYMSRSGEDPRSEYRFMKTLRCTYRVYVDSRSHRFHLKY